MRRLAVAAARAMQAFERVGTPMPNRETRRGEQVSIVQRASRPRLP